MANVNKVILIGRITKDIELKSTPKGTALAELSLATNRSRNDEHGQRQEETTFHDVTLWGKTAELASKYLSKGREVYIEGRLHMEKWQDKATGQNRSRLKIVGERMEFLGSGNQKQQQGQPAAAVPQFSSEDDIPF